MVSHSVWPAFLCAEKISKSSGSKATVTISKIASQHGLRQLLWRPLPMPPGLIRSLVAARYMPRELVESSKTSVLRMKAADDY